jgi:hypothetical protein
VRLNQKLSLALGTVSLVAAAGCGTGGSVVIPSTNGNYSKASLKGSYVYEIHGTQFATLLAQPYREYGVFTADGAGNITAQSDDASTNLGGGAFTCNASCGSYQVAADGTGFITLNNSAFSASFSPALGPITFALTLTSSTKAYLMEGDFFASGAGVAEFQDPTAIAATPSGAFVFGLHQTSSAQGQFPTSQAGVVTLPGSGVNSAMDQNLGGTFTSPTATWTLAAPGALGRGTGSFTDSASFTTTFVYYIVNGSKFVVMVSNPGAIGSGSAEAQTGAVSAGLSGSYAFGSRGDDSNFLDGLATVGQFTASAGTISGAEDLMQDGNYSNGNLSGSYSAAANGRVAVSLNSGAIQQIFWMVSPARAFFLTNNSSQIEDGTADLQTVNSFSASTMKGQFALVMDGLDLTQFFPPFNSVGTLARVGALQFDGTGRLALTELANNSLSGNGAQSPGGLTGTYAVSANGRATGTLSNSGAPPLDLVMYAISGSDAYALQVDGGTNTSGPIELQH